LAIISGHIAKAISRISEVDLLGTPGLRPPDFG
jgi:hypothetical protein